MKVHALVATALAMPQDTVTTEKENFITSGVKFYLEMDSVMGGVSTAKLEHDDEQLHFTGQLSLENNGGFASFWGKIDNKLSNFDGVHFSARINDPAREIRATVHRDGNSALEWEHVIALEKEFKSFEIPFDSFTWRFMASTGTNIPCPPGSRLSKVGMLLLDGNTDPFSVDIETIEGFNF